MLKKAAFAAAAAVAFAAPASAATTITLTQVGLTWAGAAFALVNGSFALDYRFTAPVDAQSGVQVGTIAIGNASEITFSTLTLNGQALVEGPEINGARQFSINSLIDGGVENVLLISGTAGANAGITTSVVIQAVPEPATWALFILGFGGIGYTMRRRSNLARQYKASLNFA